MSCNSLKISNIVNALEWMRSTDAHILLIKERCTHCFKNNYEMWVCIVRNAAELMSGIK